ncbi:MAG: T9SS type A sorting domain-containing protein, partial [Bacteroidia bacterium]
KVSLYNISGQMVQELKANETISTKDFPDGTYFVTIVNDDVSIAKKLIIAHR